MAIWPPKVASRYCSWALVCQVATCRFCACFYRRSYLTPWKGTQTQWRMDLMKTSTWPVANHNNDVCISVMPSCHNSRGSLVRKNRQTSVTLSTLGARSFSVASPEFWNPLPPVLHSCNCPHTFHRPIKTRCFQPAFLYPRYLTLCTSDSAFADITRIYIFHLFAYLDYNLAIGNGLPVTWRNDSSYSSDNINILQKNLILQKTLSCSAWTNRVGCFFFRSWGLVLVCCYYSCTWCADV